MEDSERKREDLDVHLHVHLDGPITINVVPQQPPRRRAEKATLTTGDGQMAGRITVDTAGKVEIQFVDDKGDTDAAAPAGNGTGVVYTFASDTPAVATVAQDATNPLVGDVTGLTEGTANISATILNTDGSPVSEPDGVTPFAVPPLAITVGAGLAVSASLAEE